MARLEYRICSGTTPQGKQKIYFCCHPDDFGEYFDLICEDIFSKETNCAIYYDADPRGPFDRDDLLLQLSDMQFLVVPVTWRFLTEPNRALELELPYALGKIPNKDGQYKHIAVLPVLFGSDLMKKFTDTELFEDIQYLDRYSNDRTALSYDEKLRRFLETVIVGEAEAEKIRSEFRAGIFLSYRKIDRALARRLMEKIHKHDLCRDVSIWYDEYLVPGESWRESINDAMSSSDLFVLNVTPQLLEEGNFVFREEYPRARELEKMPILAVVTDIENTNLKTLKKMYKDVEKHLVMGDDDDALEKGLVWGLSDKATGAGKDELLTPDNSAVHLYYIGLGYKHGVSVEVTPEKAVGLLRKAGKEGHHRAYLTLGHMYENGDGIARDDQKAIENYNLFIEKQTPYFGTSRQGDLDLVNAYDSKGLLLKKADDLEAALSCYRELNGLLRGMNFCYGSFKQINLPISYERIAMIYSAMGSTKDAVTYYDEATEVRMHPPVTRNIATEEEKERDKATADAYNRKEAKSGAAVNEYSIGQILEESLDTEGAKGYYLDSNELFVSLNEEFPDDDDIALNLAKTYLALSRIYAGEYNTAESDAYDGKALPLLERLAANPHGYEAKKMLVVYNIQAGDKLRKSHNYTDAKKPYLEAYKGAEELVRKDNSKDNRYLLATVNEKLGLTANHTGMIDMGRGLKPASSFFADELSIMEELAADSQNSEYRRTLSIAYENLGKIARENEFFEQAIDYYQKDLGICRTLANESKDGVTPLRDLSVCYDQLSILYQMLGNKEEKEKGSDGSNYKKALDYAVRSLIIAFKLAPGASDLTAVNDLATSLFRVGTLCTNVRKECFYYAERIWTRELAATKDSVYKNNLDVMKQVQSHGKDYVSEKGMLTLRNLIRRYPGGSEVDVDFLLGKESDEHSYESGRRIMSLLTTAVLLVLVVLFVLQLMGIIDLRGLFNSKPVSIAVGLVAGFLLITAFSNLKK